MTPADLERARWAVYAAITTVLRGQHPRRFEVARALERLARGWA